MGKLIVIEGLDGSGKSTQLELLGKRLLQSGNGCRTVSFPNYNSKACEPVKMYLAGRFGMEPGDVNAYAASAFYAVDRFASYKEDWGKYYFSGGTVICGRYVTSNAVHQCSKLPQDKWQDFINWLYDFEYKKIGIPSPDAVIFLSMPPEFSEELLLKRYSGDEGKKDIHEKDIDYQRKCRQAAVFAAEHGKWITVNCIKDGKVRSIESISDEIWGTVSKIIKE